MCSLRAGSICRSLSLVALLAAGCGAKGVDGTPFQHTDSGFPDIGTSATDVAHDTHADGGADTGMPADTGGGDTAPVDSAIPGVIVVVTANAPAQNAIVPSA